MVGHAVEALDDADDAVRQRLDDATELTADHVLLLFGYRPNTDIPWLKGLALACDDGGYLAVDGNMETSCPGVFAAGDVANPLFPSIATALGSGSMAARAIQRRLTRA
jgi:thioredoxin reductase (NADPH)